MFDVPAPSAPAFECHVSSAGRRSIVRITGEVDAAASATLAPLVSGLGPNHAVTVDLSDVTFMDSVGLRTLVEWHQSVTSDGGMLTLSRPGAAVRRLLIATSLDELFHIEDEAPPKGDRTVEDRDATA